MVKFISNIGCSNQLFHGVFLHDLDAISQTYALVDGFFFFHKSKSYFPKVVALLEHVILRASVSDTLSILERGFDYLFVILQAGFGESYVNGKSGKCPKFMV